MKILIPFRILSPLCATLLLAGALLLTSCKPQDSISTTEPAYQDTTILESGEISHVTIYNGPSTQTDRVRIATYLKGHVTIYSNDLVVLTEPNGYKHAAPLEWCSDIVYK